MYHEAKSTDLLKEAQILKTEVKADQPLSTAEDRANATHQLQESITHTVHRIYSCKKNLLAFSSRLEFLLCWLGEAREDISNSEAIQVLRLRNSSFCDEFEVSIKVQRVFPQLRKKKEK